MAAKTRVAVWGCGALGERLRVKRRAITTLLKRGGYSRGHEVPRATQGGPTGKTGGVAGIRAAHHAAGPDSGNLLPEYDARTHGDIAHTLTRCFPQVKPTSIDTILIPHAPRLLPTGRSDRRDSTEARTTAVTRMDSMSHHTTCKYRDKGSQEQL